MLIILTAKDERALVLVGPEEGGDVLGAAVGVVVDDDVHGRLRDKLLGPVGLGAGHGAAEAQLAVPSLLGLELWEENFAQI